jgi:hypothetical protein
MKRRGRALKRRYGRASVEKPFQVTYDWAGVRYGRGTSPFELFAEANRAAIEVVRSGKSKHAAVIFVGKKRPEGLPPSQVLAEYILSPSGGIQSVSIATPVGASGMIGW